MCVFGRVVKEKYVVRPELAVFRLHWLMSWCRPYEPWKAWQLVKVKVAGTNISSSSRGCLSRSENDPYWAQFCRWTCFKSPQSCQMDLGSLSLSVSVMMVCLLGAARCSGNGTYRGTESHLLQRRRRKVTAKKKMLFLQFSFSCCFFFLYNRLNQYFCIFLIATATVW